MLPVLVPLFAPAIATLLTGLVTWGLSILNQKVKNDKAQKALSTLNEIIKVTVMNATQTTVEELKKKGEFNKARQNEIKEKVLKQIQETVTQEVILGTQVLISDVNEYIKKKIEEIVEANN